MEKNARAAGRRLVLLCGVAPALLTAALAVYRPSSFTRADWRVYDGMLRSLPRPGGPSSVAVVDIDDQSLTEIGQWPWNRSVVAELVTRIRDMGAASVALDIVFPESDRFQPPSSPDHSSDDQLARTLARGGVVLGYAFTFNAGSVAPTRCVMHPLTIPVLEAPGAANAAPAFRASGVVCSLTPLARAAGASGFLNAIPDADGMLRRVPLVIDYDGRVYPGLALAAVMAARHAQPVALRVQNVNTSSLVLDTGAIPLDGRGNLLLRYRGGGRSLPYVSAADVLMGRADAGHLKNAVVMVGATALGTRDGVSTALDTVFPGVEVQATVADNLLRGDFIARPPDALTVEIAGILSLGIAATLLVARLGLAWGSAASGVLLVLAWRGALFVMAANGTYLSPLFPSIGLVASLAAATLTKLAYERRRADRAAGRSDAAQRMMVQSLLSLTEIRDAETGNHSRRTQQYSRLLALHLREHPRFREYLTPARIDLLSSLAPLHDIGKVGVPDHLLNKPGPLTADELKEMQKHPNYGLSVISTAQRRAVAAEDDTLAMAKDIVYTHHERWDGHGYPRGLRGEEIPIPGRVMAVVDVYDALTTMRCYREALPHDRAVELIVNGEGTHFDPAVVDAFLRSASLLPKVAHNLTSDTVVSMGSR